MLTHTASRLFAPVTESMLTAAPYPERLKAQGTRWKPIVHSHLIDETREAFGRHGIPVPEFQISRSLDYRKMIATVDLPDVTGRLDAWAERGIRQSLSFGLVNDNSSGRSLVCLGGSRVFICTNGMLIGTTLGRRKHTTGLDLREHVRDIVDGYLRVAPIQVERQSRLLDTPVDPSHARRLFFRAAQERVIPDQYLVQAMRLWQEPPHPEFRQPNAWCYYQAWNEALKASPLAQQAEHLSRSFEWVERAVLN